MSRSFTLSDPSALDDLATFVGRAGAIEEGALRMIGASGVLAVYAAVLYPTGLMDDTPTVLGLRTYAISTGPEFFDAVVPIRSFQQRIESARLRAAAVEEEGVTVNLPLEVHTVTWAGISPPRGGWHEIRDEPADRLLRVAEEGIAEIARAVPDAVGEQLVRRARGEVWSRPIEGIDDLPTGAAFAQFSLGFLGDDVVRLYESGPWSRLTTRRGHVLVKRRSWRLAQ